MSEVTPQPTLTLEHTAMSEVEALKFLEGHRITRGARTMDPKAQIVGEFVKSIRVPGYFPPLPELRQQLRTMVQLMDEPAPRLARIENITIPGPAGAIPGRVYDAAGVRAPARAVVAYFYGGGWVQRTFRTPRIAIHVFSLGHFFPRTTHPHSVMLFSYERRDIKAFTSGAWYGARSTAYRSVPSPTSAHCEGLCRQDWFGRGDQSVGPDGDGDRSWDHCAGHDPRHLEWTESAVSLGRVLYASRYGPTVG